MQLLGKEEQCTIQYGSNAQGAERTRKKQTIPYFYKCNMFCCSIYGTQKWHGILEPSLIIAIRVCDIVFANIPKMPVLRNFITLTYLRGINRKPHL